MSSSKRNASKITPSQGGTSLRRTNSISSAASQVNTKAVIQLPDVKKFENAPEIAHLIIQPFTKKSKKKRLV
jgi:hypothetical protein